MIKIVNQARSDIPAITHVDYSARVQTVTGEDHHAHIHLYQGFEFREAEMASASFWCRGELEQIYSLMQTGNKEGMLLLEQSLANLYAFGLVSKEEALSITRDLSIFDARVKHIQETRGNLQPA